MAGILAARGLSWSGIAEGGREGEGREKEICTSHNH